MPDDPFRLCVATRDNTSLCWDRRIQSSELVGLKVVKNTTKSTEPTSNYVACLLKRIEEPGIFFYADFTEFCSSFFHEFVVFVTS